MIRDFKENTRVTDIFLCKQKSIAKTKADKEYYNVVLQDKTGTISAKVWDPKDSNINDFKEHDFVQVVGDISSYNGALQMSIKSISIANPSMYNPSDLFPTTDSDIEQMYERLTEYIDLVDDIYLHKLLKSFFDNDRFVRRFKENSAAKTVHHSFIGGLLEHTLSVAGLCSVISLQYPIINKDLLLTAAICHDIGKVKEISLFPENDYTDEGTLIGHIVLGTEMITEHAKQIEGFPKPLLAQLKHCILSHHGELEYGSPKKPALIEAVALSFADNLDAKIETFTEAINTNSYDDSNWIGYNRFLESNLRKTTL